MTYSMTAFARVQQPTQWGTLIWEIRSVNSRYLEIHTRLPETFRSLDLDIRGAVKKALKRGKVECQLKFEANSSNQSFEVNEELVKSLAGACEKVGQIFNNSSTPNPLAVLQYPGVLVEAGVDQEALDKETLDALQQALVHLKNNRQREGEELANLIRDRLTQIGAIASDLKKEAPQWVSDLRDQLQQKVAELKVEIDPERLEQEVAILAQKIDVAEELDRLEAHIKETQKVLNTKNDAIGRRLDFLMQEFNREVNTLSSKAVNKGITQQAVELKVLVEQMREQIQNIE